MLQKDLCMSSKLITKLKNRPNFYYYDIALKDQKRLTVKYCLFTNDEYQAMIIANKIKYEADRAALKKLNSRTVNSKLSTNFKSLIKNRLADSVNKKITIQENKAYLSTAEYKGIFQRVVGEFYGVYNTKICCTEKENIKQPKIELSFSQIANQYVKTECEKSKSSNKTKGYYIKTGKMLDEFFKNLESDKITYQECEKFQLHLINDKNLNKKTINNYTCYATRLFDYALKIKMVQENPFKLLTPFKISREDKSPRDNFTHDELRKILSTDKSELRNYMLFALHTGLRLSEIWSLDSGCVSEQDGIKFVKVQTMKQKCGAIKYRELPIHKNIEPLADLKWLEDIKQGRNNCDYFSKRLNKHIHKILPNSNVNFHRLRANFAKAVKDYALENGFTDITSVLLGHATDLATDVYAKGISLKAKMKALGGLDIFGELSNPK